ncbi:FAD binding domain-containing protein [uncultured Sphaerochaeta sp.]|uniref:FAD binding domain-containing protein n=1 Tax=uncultured Sphaerochaeta sp. TaxID=886478 RepID=UPI002A0A6CBF|nr:FAD binding domain-containing protein [uncultured Sphaerochaeta sp.]
MIQEFLIADDIKNALALKRNNPRSIFYAGGTEINRLDSTIEAKTAISLVKLKLNTITEDGSTIHIGSMVTFQQLLDSPLVPQWLKDAAIFCGSFPKRNMATIGGNLALGRDDSYLAPVLLASRCRLCTASLTENGNYCEDNVPIREYHAYHNQFKGTLLIAFIISKAPRFIGTLRFSNTVESHAAVTVGFGASVDGEGVIDHVRMYAAVKGSGIQRLSSIENAIENGELTTETDVQLAIVGVVEAKDDFFGSSAYKRYIASESLAKLYAKFLEGGTK